MRIWGVVPFLRILVPVIAGILFSIFTEVPLYLPVSFFLFGVLTVFIRLFFGKKFPRRFEWIAGIGFSLCFLSLGLIRVYLEKDFRFNHHYTQFKNIIAVKGTLSDELHSKSKSLKTTIRIVAVRDSAGWHKSHGEVLFYTNKSPKNENLTYGDLVLIHAKPSRIDEPSNPEEFNYKRYLYFHNVYAQVYAPDGKWILLKESESSLIGFSLRLRQKLISVLDRYLIKKEEVAVAAALVLGFRDHLDIEQINAFSSAGAMHVLAVSGMHVGILFMMLGVMLSWFDKLKRIRWLKHILLLLFIWFYAMITGFSPSVMRASVMISVIITGQMILRRGNIYNSMLLSATVLLLYNPFMITEVGFQLSFLAVFGIVAWHPVVFQWFEPANWLIHKIWEITSVSISAQLMTFPLGLLYFHQFPLLFFISNLIVIPLAFVIMLCTIVLLVLSFIPFMEAVLTYAAIIVFAIIYFLNQSVLIFDKQATSVLKGITISITETWLIYVIILFGFLFLTQKIPRYFIAALVSFVLLLSYQVFESCQQAHQQYFVCYSAGKYQAFNFIEGRKQFLFANDTLRANKSMMLFHINHHQWATGALRITEFNPQDRFINHYIHKDSSVAVFAGKRFCFQSSFPEVADAITPLVTDYLILSDRGKFHFESLKRSIEAGSIILDSTFPKWKAERLMKKIKGNVYSVSHSGAFVADLKP